MEERLQKILSRAGVTSRRKAEQYILEGRVRVNGKTITELGSKADLSCDHIKVDGKLLHAPHRKVYVVLNKPKGYVTTVSDPQHRPTVMELMKGIKERVYPVGRLDFNTEGLLLLTNDGDFANRITSASSQVPKIYVARVNGSLTEEQEEKFRNGLKIDGRRTAPAGLKRVRGGLGPSYEIRLIEGRTHQVKLMFEHFGRQVEQLRRVKIGFLELGAVPIGKYRLLTLAEVERFRRLLKITEEES